MRELEASLQHRVSECCELRIKDVDFDQGLLFVRGGKGNKDRSTLLAEIGRDELSAQLRHAEVLHQEDRKAGLAGVWVPDALERKYPNAGRELGWFWVFPSQTLSTDPRAGVVRRHHLSDSVIQKAVKAAARQAARLAPAEKVEAQTRPNDVRQMKSDNRAHHRDQAPAGLSMVSAATVSTAPRSRQESQAFW